MSIGKPVQSQGTLWVSYDQLLKSLNMSSTTTCNGYCSKAAFTALPKSFVSPTYAKGKGRPSIPPGRYFRMLLVGYFEGIDSERGICWRCADPLPLREFLRFDIGQCGPDLSLLSHIRSCLGAESGIPTPTQAAPKYDKPADLAGDKGHHSRRPSSDLAAPFVVAFANPNTEGSTTGTGTRTPAVRPTTIERVSNQQRVKSCINC